MHNIHGLKEYFAGLKDHFKNGTIKLALDFPEEYQRDFYKMNLLVFDELIGFLSELEQLAVEKHLSQDCDKTSW